jgi:hypothetical protein
MTVTTLISMMPTKKEFAGRVRDGVNVTLFDPYSGHRTSLRDIHDNVGHTITVTNKRRSWFASVTVLADRRLRVT